MSARAAALPVCAALAICAALALCAALLLAGCSHAPKPAADSAASDTTAGGRSAGPVKPRRPAAPNAGAVVAGSSTSAPAALDTVTAPALVPQLSSEEAKELERSSREQIETARLRLAGLDASKLDADRQRKLQIAQGFLADAVAARAQQDWMRASQLATKARVLADELVAR